MINQRDSILRLFQQMHQDIETDWYRANGSMICHYCGLEYQHHPTEQLFNVDKRLCDGYTVHL